jgi:hypothetical protein
VGCKKLSVIKCLCRQHYCLKRNHDLRGGPPLPDSRFGKHEVVLESLKQELLERGVETEKMLTNRCPYDLLTHSGIRIELKVAEMQLGKGWGPNRWGFNLHRHGKRFDADKCDYVVLAAIGLKTWILPSGVIDRIQVLNASNFKPLRAREIKPPKWAKHAISFDEFCTRARRRAEVESA